MSKMRGERAPTEDWSTGRGKGARFERARRLHLRPILLKRAEVKTLVVLRAVLIYSSSSNPRASRKQRPSLQRRKHLKFTHVLDMRRRLFECQASCPCFMIYGRRCYDCGICGIRSAKHLYGYRTPRRVSQVSAGGNPNERSVDDDDEDGREEEHHGCHRQPPQAGAERCGKSERKGCERAKRDSNFAFKSVKQIKHIQRKPSASRCKDGRQLQGLIVVSWRRYCNSLHMEQGTA